MSRAQEPIESLSPRAAAFAINRLLMEDARNQASYPRQSLPHREQSAPVFSLHSNWGLLPCRENHGTDTSEGRQQIQRAANNSTQQMKTKTHTIENILEKVEQVDPGCEAAPASCSLQQLAACGAGVRSDEKDAGGVHRAETALLHVRREVQLALQHGALWWKFYSCGTEMVITRTGRRMFPTLALSVLGMDPRKNYAIHVDIVPVDGFSYTFVNNQWQVNGIASEMHAFPYVQSFQADEVARSGQYWMKNGIDFKKVRLTNRRTGAFKDGELHLSPNRKYQPRIHVIEETEEKVQVGCSTFVFPETSFIAVTTYQNEELIQMKIDHNPFAKGFRDKGSRRRFAPYEHGQEKPDSSPLCSSIHGLDLAYPAISVTHP